jgi:hypothetical protein
MYGLAWVAHSSATYVVELEGRATPGLLETVAYLYLRYALMNRCGQILVRATNLSALYTIEPAGSPKLTTVLRCRRIRVHQAPAGTAATEAQ